MEVLMRCIRILLLVFLGVFALSPGHPARAADKLVAVIIPADLPRYRAAHEAFEKTLRAGGFDEKKVQVFVQTPSPDLVSLTNSVRKAVGVSADAMVTYGAELTTLAKKLGRKVPVLFADVYDPVALGLVKSLAAPGGNLSGASGKVPLEKLLTTASQLLPGKTLGVLYNPEEEESALQARDLDERASTAGVTFLKQEVRQPGDLDRALGFFSAKAGGVILTESFVLKEGLERIQAFGADKEIALLSLDPTDHHRNILMALGAEPEEQGQLVAVHTLQVLRGQKAHILPIRAPKKIRFTLNRQNAAALGLTIPPGTLEAFSQVYD